MLKLFSFQEVGYVVVVYDLFPEVVSASFWRLHHFNHFCEILAFSAFECCYYLLCHVVECLRLFNFFVNSHAFQDRVVFFQLDALCGVLFVFGGNVTGSTWLSAFFMLCAF